MVTHMKYPIVIFSFFVFLLAESVNELNKMDIFVCGTCYFVSHFVEEFIGHKEEPCERTENIQPNTSVSYFLHTPKVLTLHFYLCDYLFVYS